MHPERPSDPTPRTIDLVRGPMTYVDEGATEGAPALALHGLPGSLRDFRWLAPAVSAHGRLLRVDFPGFGGTPERTGPAFDVPSRAALVVEFLDAMGIERVDLLGHSMGGIIATAVADAWPDRVARLVLLATPGLREHRALRRMPYRTMAALLRSQRRARWLRPVVSRLFAAGGFRGRYADGAYRRTMLQLEQVDIPAHADRLRRATVPTGVFWCEDDPLIEPDIPQAMAQVVPPGARRCFADGGHNPQKFYAIEIAECLAADWPRDDKRGTSKTA
ncbi:MAG: alpha/beta fold hydrolase [Deltaproteobacteria bacterium]